MRHQRSTRSGRYTVLIGAFVVLGCAGFLLSCSEDPGSTGAPSETVATGGESSGSSSSTNDPSGSSTSADGGSGTERETAPDPEMSARTWFRAAQNGKVDTIQKGLKQGMKPDRARRGGRTALMDAALYGHTDVVRLLIEHGADVTNPDKRGLSPLLMAASGNNPDTVRLLLKHGADPNRRMTFRDRWTPLMMAAGEGQKKVVKMLLKHGADPDLEDEDGHTAYDHASNAGHRAVAELLK